MAALPFEFPPDAWEIFDVSVAPNEAGLDRYLERVMWHAESLFAASSVSLFLRHGNTDEFRAASRRGSARLIPDEAVIREGVGFAGEAIEKRTSTLVQDPSLLRNVGSSMIVPLIGPDGHVLGVMNVSRKVSQAPFGPSELRHADTVARQIALAVSNARLYSEARQAQDRLATLLEAIPMPMFVVEAGGHVASQNAAARTLTSTPHFDQMGRVEHAGRVFWLSQREIPTGGQVVTVDDVTEREKAAAEAASLRHLAEIGRMTATIAHEIRNPLTGIRSAAQMLKEAPEHSSEWAEIVEGETSRLEGLCEQFLTYARPLELRMAATDLSELGMRVASLHQAEFAESGVVLLLHTPAEPACLRADPPRLEQVMHNLLRNARQACSEGGKVILTVRADGFRVEDTGCGMSPEDLAQVGRPFFTTKTRGTGLGLSTVKKIIEAHSGRLSVESELGRGTKVTVSLPGNHP